MAPYGLEPVYPNRSLRGRRDEPYILYHLRNFLEGDIYSRMVKCDRYTYRSVYYNSKGVQIGVISSFSYEPEYPTNPYFVEWHPFRVSVPLETSRRSLHYRSIFKAEKFLRRELTPVGRFINSVVLVLTSGNKFARTGWN